MDSQIDRWVLAAVSGFVGRNQRHETFNEISLIESMPL
jgi:hypothetical protein